MPLHDDIKKVTSLDCRDNSAQFLRLQGSSQAKKDREMNEKKVGKPRNVHLMENCDETMDEDVDNIMIEHKYDSNKYEISAAIKEVNGGKDLSNEYWLDCWLDHLQKISPERETKSNDARIHPKNHLENEDPYYTIKKRNPTNKLYRNAAIMGLVRTNIISLDEIIDERLIESNTLLAQTKNKCSALNQHEASSVSNNMMDNAQCHIESVPLPDDPEVFVHPLQMGLDPKQFEGIDFTLSRLGKKVIETPSEFFLAANQDEYFDFVKNK